jgi:hypothetical protein
VQRDWWRLAWRGRERSIEDLELELRRDGVAVRRGGDFDSWELAAWCGTLGHARARLAVEEHGAGKQRVRWRLWACASSPAAGLAGLLGTLALGAALAHAWLAATVLSGFSAALAWRLVRDCGMALGALDRALRRIAQ